MIVTQGIAEAIQAAEVVRERADWIVFTLQMQEIEPEYLQTQMTHLQNAVSDLGDAISEIEVE